MLKPMRTGAGRYSASAFDPVADRTGLVYRPAINRCVEVRVVRMKWPS
jgi:hypothetical protein